MDIKVNEALKITNTNDTLMIAFDNIGSPLNNEEQSFDSVDFIQNTINKCRVKRVNLMVSKYYCFEEVYNTYEELERLCRISNNDKAILLADALKYVRDCVDSGVEYYDKSNKHVKDIISISTDADYNKEHFNDVLLRHSTSEIEHGYFTITKGKNGLGKCWISSCDKLRSNKNSKKAISQITYFCNNCKFKLKEQDDTDKLLDLNNNSILRYASVNFVDLSK